MRGDGDPLDVCVLTLTPITHSDLLLQARPIGGIRLIDGDEADDKIIAVLAGDGLFGGYLELAEVPQAAVLRLSHYFETYKTAPGSTTKPIEIAHTFGRDEAHEIIRAARQDYSERFGALQEQLAHALA